MQPILNMDGYLEPQTLIESGTKNQNPTIVKSQGGDDDPVTRTHAHDIMFVAVSSDVLR